jgi:hypothetical protein
VARSVRPITFGTVTSPGAVPFTVYVSVTADPLLTVDPALGSWAVTLPLLPTAESPAARGTRPAAVMAASAVARSVRPVSSGTSTLPAPGPAGAPPLIRA